ncbi:polysaccharide deacetylase family protein [Novosphingobium sp.]|uniref:polysaccharide deacetylase family protein n=1 Tax=Novosphingobium sp. TaxID=1874826 RepID=UPI003D1219BC
MVTRIDLGAKTQSPRYAFNPITRRRPVAFPGDRKLALLIYLNIEHVPFGSTGLAHAIYPPTLDLSPDILNHGWRDYGNRVGLWRIADALDKHGLKATVNLNADVTREYPEIIREGNRRGWEWGGQGDNNTSIPTRMTREDEAAFIERSLAIIAQETGHRPRGWLSMCLAESHDTPDLLAAAGIEYVSNYTHDELPVPMTTKSGSLISMPYTLEINDVPTIMGKGTTAEAFGTMIRDQFDVLYAEAEDLPRVMSISVHPFITGHPFRMKHFAAALAYIAGHAGVWPATGGEINDWFRSHFMSPGAQAPWVEA